MARLPVRALAGVATVVLLVAANALAADWRTYRNARFGFAVEYPANLLTMQPPPANDDGRAFSARVRRIDVTVSASHNAPDATVSQLYAQTIARYGPETVSYKRRGDAFFVVSGIKGKRVYYEYVQIARKGGNEYAGRLVVRYPAEEKAVMDPVVARMQRRFASSFRQMPPAR